MPNSFEDQPPARVKERLLCFAGRDLAYRMARAGFLTQEAEHHLSYLYAIGSSLQARRRGFKNIYDLALFGFLLGYENHQSSWIFRGQYDGRQRLVPSFYRTRRDLLRPERVARIDYIKRMLHALVEKNVDYEAPFALESKILRGWREERLRKLEALKRQPGFSLIGSLSEYEQGAVIQHYMSGTPFLDFTKSILVAAFFATHRFGRRRTSQRPRTGAIYVISTDDIQRQVALGHITPIELPAHFVRPHRQRAVFILTAWPELLRDKSLFIPWTFQHTLVGENFESEDFGITSSLLLADPNDMEPGDSCARSP